MSWPDSQDVRRLWHTSRSRFPAPQRTGTWRCQCLVCAAVLDREEKFAFDKMICVVSTEQDLNFRRVFRTLELMGRPDLAVRLQHVNFGKVMGMSSRLGNAQLLGDILDQSREAMHEVMRRNEVKYAPSGRPGRRGGEGGHLGGHGPGYVRQAHQQLSL